MAQQLIFTSAVAGLNPGSSGYCTVARSETMRDAVVARLEQWSIYTHGVGEKNPVICAYRVLNLRGSVFHVLTRIVDSGLDYTGRTNFLAHHLVFQPHEIHGACSPAEVFSQWPGWKRQWNGNPQHLDDSELSLHDIPRTTQMPAATWAEWTGDAGAATLLVSESGGSAVARSVDLIVPEGFEEGLLRLYAESLHLIDPKGENAPTAWAAPFTTFLQSQDDATDFRWRGFLPRNRVRTEGELLVDFAAGIIPSANPTSLVEYARTGVRKAAYLPGVNVKEFVSGTPTLQQAASTPQLSAGTRTRLSSASPERRDETVDQPHTQWAGVPAWMWFTILIVILFGVAACWRIISQHSRMTQNVSAVAATAKGSANPPSSMAAPTPTQFHETAPVESTHTDPTPIPAEAMLVQLQEQLDRMANRLKKEYAPEGAGDLTSPTISDALSILSAQKTRPDLNQSVVDAEEEKVNNLLSQAEKANHVVADTKEALKEIPGGIVYVVLTSTDTIELKDRENPLANWLEDNGQNRANADHEYRVKFQSSVNGINEKPFGLTYSAGASKLVCAEGSYSFFECKKKGEMVSIKWRTPSSLVPSGSVLISFISQKPEHTDFHVLVVENDPMFSIPEQIAFDPRADQQKIRLKKPLDQLLPEKLKDWKNADGKVLVGCLIAQLEPPSDPPKPQQGFQLDFGENQQNCENNLADANGRLAKWRKEKTNSEQASSNIKAAKEFFQTKWELSSKTRSAISSLNSTKDINNGQALYNRIGHWITDVCGIEDGKDIRLYRV